jgi:TPR repeat protein
VAYLEGSTVTQDPNQAVRWLQRAATLGSRTAQAKLGAAQARISGSTR